MRDRAGVADVFDAEQAFRIPGRLFQLRRRDISGVFLRLREVDGNFKFAVLRVRNPMLILCDAVAADIVAVLAEFVKIICRIFGTFRIQRPELPDNF